MAEQVMSAAPVPTINRVGFRDLAAVLRLGWRDFTRAPLYGLFFAAVYVAGRLADLVGADDQGATLVDAVASAGFPILAPFLACGLYEVSRRLEAGERAGLAGRAGRGGPAEGPPDPVDGGGDRGVLPVLELPRPT